MKWLLWFPGQTLLCVVPNRFLPYKLASFLGKIYCYFSKRKVAVVRDELARSAGTSERAPKDLDAIIERSMRLDAVDQLEMLNYPRFGNSPKGKALALKTIPAVKGLEHLDNALTKSGVILAHLHFGPMQMALPGLAHRGYPVAQIGNSRLSVLEDPSQGRSFFLKMVLAKQQRFEERLPVPFFYTGEDTRAIVKWLKDGNVLDLAMDGRTGSKWIETAFLGRRARFVADPFHLARLTRASILPAFILRDPDTLRLRIHIEPPVLQNPDTPGNSNEKMLNTFLALAEQYFKAYPCHYCRRLWVMNRQKPFLANPLFPDGS